MYSLEVRYYIGFIVFAICVPFAFSLNTVLQGSFKRFFKAVTLSIVFLFFYQSFVYSTGMIRMINNNCAVILSGYSPGNIKTADPGMDKLRWVTHILDSRTMKNEHVLYAGINYAYGLKRKIFFSSDLDRQVIGDFADKSSNASSLRDILMEQGIRHILISSSFYNDYKNNRPKKLLIKQNNLNKISDLIHNYMELRFTSPDEYVSWYSFKGNVRPPDIILNVNDVIQYPLSYIADARSKWLKGQLDASLDMIEIAISVPMHRYNKALAYSIRGAIWAQKGYKEKAEHAMIFATKVAPDNPEPYINLALMYDAYGENDKKVAELVKKAIDLGGKLMIQNNVNLNRYLFNE